MKINNKLFNISILILLMIMLSFLYINVRGMNRFIASSDETTVVAMEEAIRKAAVQCYALEGGYPPDIHYLRDNYGILINEEDYFYYYEIMASNILPNIKVIKK